MEPNETVLQFIRRRESEIGSRYLHRRAGGDALRSMATEVKRVFFDLIHEGRIWAGLMVYVQSIDVHLSYTGDATVVYPNALQGYLHGLADAEGAKRS